MSRYKFSLQTLLNHRQHHEEMIQKEMAVCGCRLRDEKCLLDQIQRDKDKTIEENHQKQLQGIALSEHVLYVNYLEGLARNMALQHEKVNASEQQFTEKRQDLIEAVKKRKSLEKLKEKKLAAYTHELMKLDQDFLDEVAICRFHKETP